MEHILACLDGRAPSPALLDLAVWAARRLQAPLHLLHVLERTVLPRPSISDHGGALGLAPFDALRHELGELDERRARLEEQLAEQLLAAAQAQVLAAGLAACHSSLRQGELAETLVQLQEHTQLVLMGEHFRAPGQRLHLDHRIERVLRQLERPVLVLTAAPFVPPARVLLAFDGSVGARRSLQLAAASPLLQGLELELLWVGGDEASARAALAEAQQTLQAAGRMAAAQWLDGAPEAVLPARLADEPDTLLLMGAHGHSRLRQLVLGSTTASLLRSVAVPVLVSR